MPTKTAQATAEEFPFCTPWGLYVLSLVVVAHDEITRGILRLMGEAMEDRRAKKRDHASKKKQQRRKKRK